TNAIERGLRESTVSAEPEECDLTDIACGILRAGNYVLDKFMMVGFDFGKRAVASAIDENKKLSAANQQEFVKTGWPIVRDIANIFFVFILLWIALATIFDVETYSAKKLLPTFIISALLINFSLPIGTFVIGTANSLGNVYWSKVNLIDNLVRIQSPVQQLMKEETTPDKDLPRLSAEKQITYDEIYKKGIEVNIPYNPKITMTGDDCTRLLSDVRSKKKPLPGRMTSMSDEKKVTTCLELYGKLGRDADALYLSSYGQASYAYARQLAVKIILYPVTIFVLFAVAILLLVRYVSLLFLLVLGPFAFLSMILPSTEKYWHDWWDKLIKHSLFFPAFSIMFFIALKTLDALNELEGGASVLSYILTIIFIVGILIVAQQLGIAGANTAMSIGKRASGVVGNFAKQRSLAYTKRGVGKIAESGLAVGLGRIPLARTVLGR
ncbi:MAG: hypothetical protein AABX37_04105, partial [Nanoarchaeota archaeon]